MDLKRPLPPNRTYDQVLRHYLVEKELASRLKASTRENRSAILNTMYDELFQKVPDHPRLTRRKDEGASEDTTTEKMALVRRFLNGVGSFLEFAPGDSKFAMTMASMVERVYGVDISDQRDPAQPTPDNFELVVYDGYHCDQLQPESIDLAFSDQLIEHIHPDDVRPHFELARSLLKPGGKYVFRTPHALTGPHDVSKYFCDHAEGFHLKEWTYIEIARVVEKAGYSNLHCFRFAKGRSARMPLSYFSIVEQALAKMPPSVARRLASPLVSSVYALAVK